MCRRALALFLFLLAGCGAGAPDTNAGSAFGTAGVGKVLYFDVRLPAGQTSLVRGPNTVRVAVFDARGNAQNGCALSASATMPSMGHGGAGAPAVIEESPGLYRVEGIDCSMGGTWRLRLEATAPGGASDVFAADYFVN